MYNPIFTDKYFLDWYEEWLNEIIQDDAFLAQLLHELTASDDSQVINALKSLKQFKKIKPTEALVALLAHTNQKISNTALYLLTEHDYKKAKPFLLELINSQDDEQALVACQSVFWYVKKKKKLKEWVEPVSMRLESAKSEDLLNFGFFILEDTKTEATSLLHRLVKSDNEAFRRTAYYNIGLLEDNSSFDAVLKEALKTEEPEISIQVLHAIGQLNNSDYIPHYKSILKRIPNDTFIISNVMNLLEELGVDTFDEDIQLLFKHYFDSIENNDDYEISKALIDFNRVPLPKLLEYATRHQHEEVREEAKALLKKHNKS